MEQHHHQIPEPHPEQRPQSANLQTHDLDDNGHEEYGIDEESTTLLGTAGQLRRRKGKIMSCAKETIENGKKRIAEYFMCQSTSLNAASHNGSSSLPPKAKSRVFVPFTPSNPNPSSHSFVLSHHLFDKLLGVWCDDWVIAVCVGGLVGLAGHCFTHVAYRSTPDSFTMQTLWKLNKSETAFKF